MSKSQLINPACLHCNISYTIGVWAKYQAPHTADGTPIIEAEHVIGQLAMVMSEYVHVAGQTPEALQRSQRFARECLEVAFSRARIAAASVAGAAAAATTH